MDLRDDQIEQVSLLVNRSVSMHALRVELLDHLCCHIEVQLDSGISFDSALKEATLQLSPEGFENSKFQIAEFQAILKWN
jgi:hypothetical protein